MATYNTSFVINQADLAKILEQIKVAERHANGENLVDIIGQDNALLPVGLRTVDGSFNHLLPGQEQAGAADQLFPRLLTPDYRNDLDGDTMPLGGPFVVTNTNYDPTIPVVPGPINSHSVADADPRIISNLIVDQTLSNKAALAAALLLAGSTNPSGDADAIIVARDAAAAALPGVAAALATETAYENALTPAGVVDTQASAASTALFNLFDGLGTSFTATDVSDAAAARSAVDAAVLAQQNVAVALASNPNVIAADLTAANALSSHLQTLQSAIIAIQIFVVDGDPVVAGTHDIAISDALGDPTAGANAVSIEADAKVGPTGTLTVAEAAAHAVTFAAEGPARALATLVLDNGLEISSDGSITIEHRSADIGLSPANSGWMTFFGQFFDHGLDLVTKGGNGTVYVPLQADDPLIAGADHILGTADDLAPELRFMTLTRATNFDANGNPSPTGTETENTTTPFVDQNQTYTSNASHQVFLREYAFSVDSNDVDSINDSFAVNTGKLLNGANGGIANWAEVKDQAAVKLGIKLSDNDVNDVPLLKVDPYGKFEAGANGFAQVIVNVTQTDGLTTTVSAVRVEGRAAAGGLDINHLVLTDITGSPDYDAGLGTVGSFALQHTGHAFLNDIAHTAAPVMIGGVLQEDPDTDIGNPVPNDGQGHNLQYDDELLDKHFITGDGRGNENIALTAVHTIFHSEHNRLVEANKQTILDSAAGGDLTFLNEWLVNDVAVVPADPSTLVWDGERLFQAARFVTEMQYQHLVFEEFARRIQPNVDPFVFTNSADLDPAILAEFAHTVYRFGHSMLTDTVDRLDNSLDPVNGDSDQIGLIEAFLNPQTFTASGGALSAISDEVATGAIIRGMTRQVGNEIDEFIVEAVRDNLLGLPLDLAVFNLARGRDTGVPSLNDARAELYAMTGAVDVKPYTSWIDFAQNIKHPLSIVNFIAAYGTHEAIATATTLEGKRAAATLLVLGDGTNGDGVTIGTQTYSNAERLAFLNGSDAYTGGTVPAVIGSHGGLNDIDLWIGGLAEEIKEFGGQLGSTFNFVFEYQMEHLQNGDRFYYLSRTQGMNLLNLLEPNTFTDLIMRNTDLGDLHATHLSAEIMEVPDLILELDALVAQENYGSNPNAITDINAVGYDRSLLDPTHDDSFLQAIDPKVVRVVAGVDVADGTSVDVNGDGVIDGDDNLLKFSGGEHVVLGGTEGIDTLIADKGIDTLWGDGGNDYLNAGMESDQVFGGDGDDIIEDPFGDDFLRGEAGDDVIIADLGLDLLFGGEGQDFLMGVTDFKEVFAGPGNDFVLGGTAPDALMGNEGDDWIEGGEGFDGLSGENSELFFNSAIVGHDILNGQGNDTDYDGENGDDIMVQSAGIQRNNGMDGFDWAIHKGDPNGADSDLGIRPFDTRAALILRDRFDSVEGLSGWNNDDILTGAAKPILGENFADALTQAGVDRILGMRDFLGAVADVPGDVVFESDLNVGGEIILGGDGGDTIRGNLGDDILDGDAWLDVRIAVHASKDATGPTGAVLFSVDSLTSVVQAGVSVPAAWVGQQLDQLMRTGELNPGQLQAVREILTDTTQPLPSDLGHDRDIAVFSDIQANYTIEETSPGVIGDGDGDGFITVAHTPPVGGGGGGGLRDSDGIDRIRNFEILNFADGNVFLDPTIVNAPASGLLAIIDGGATGITVGEPLTAALGTVTDPNGVPPIGAFTFSWQFEADPVDAPGVWEPVADPVTGDPVVGLTFIPTEAHELDGLRLRVVGTFRDDAGIPEVVFSAPTDPVAPAAVTVATAGDDNLIGTLGADLINALAGDDIVNALAGDDIIIGGPGNDILDGGADTDVAVFFGPLANFSFVLNAEGQLEVVDAAAIEEDAVIAIETLVFIDSPTTLTDAQVAALVAGGTLPGVTVVTRSVADIIDGDIIIDTAGADVLVGGDWNDTLIGLGGDDAIDGGVGDDIVFGDGIDPGTGLPLGADGDDTIGWRVGDGRDLVDGGGNTAIGDTADFRGSGNGDAFRIYTRAEAVLAGLGAFAATTEIVVSRQAVGGPVEIIAELDNIELIVINNVSVVTGATVADGDTIEIIGDFTGTSLSPNLAPTGMTLDGGDSGTVAENAAGAIIGPIVVTDPNAGDTFTYAINDDRFEVVGGNLKLVDGVSLDFESEPSIDLIMEVFDQGGLGSLNNAYNFTIGVTDADDAATGGITIASHTQTTTTATLTATNTIGDQDGMSNFRHQWQRLNGSTFQNIAGATAAVLAGISAGTFRVTSSYDDPFGTSTFVSSETAVVGTSASQTMIANGDRQIMLGLGGNDTINAGGGDDVVDGGAGNDRIDGGAGADTMIGGIGNDTFVVDNAGDLVNEAAGGGTDTVETALTTLTLNGTNVENLTHTGTSGFTGTGNGLANTINGGGGADILDGGQGADILNGGGGADTLIATVDTVRDQMNGGAGVDTADYSAYTANLTLTLAAAGASILNGSGSSAANSDRLTGIENFIGGSGNDTITVTGVATANRIEGGGGNDTISSNGGNDIVIGGAGLDRITGGVGADQMTGGIGDDTFVFDDGHSGTGANRDIILDFVHGDVINLTAIDSNSAVRGGGVNGQAFVLTADGGEGAFTGAGQLRWHHFDSDDVDTTDDSTMIECNTNGNSGNAEIEILLRNYLGSLSAADFNF